jgi:hypothetical protein
MIYLLERLACCHPPVFGASEQQRTDYNLANFRIEIGRSLATGVWLKLSDENKSTSQSSRETVHLIRECAYVNISNQPSKQGGRGIKLEKTDSPECLAPGKKWVNLRAFHSALWIKH